MRTVILAVALAAALSTAAMPGSDGPFTTTHWTNGLYAQQVDGAIGVFPNPASDQVNIIFPGLTGDVTVSILAEDGRVMDQVEVGQAQGARLTYNTDNLRNGAYLVRVQQEDGNQVTTRLIVAK
jgi:hypothetical protein